MTLKQNIESVKQRIAFAAKKSGRTAEQIKLVCVTKSRTVGEIKQLQALSQNNFGENRLQELQDKARQIDGAAWHFIGTLQSNKASEAVELCDYIHSVDSLKLIRKIHAKAQELDKVQNIFLEVNVSGEKTKHGFAPNEVTPLLDTLKQLPFRNIRVLGLMTLAPHTKPEQTRPVFRQLAGLAQDHHLKELSMGMTNDFEVAIEEGATFVRIGTAIFG
ncbi:MAG: YggS family pyridoxal phosphate-dependent enzyme [archaeon]